MTKKDLIKALDRFIEFVGDFEGEAVVTDSLMYAMRVEAKAIIDSTKEDWIENAAHYLCPSHISIEEQVTAITDHHDSSDYIDVVPGVIVWEPLAYRFACDEFLNLINY